MNKKLILVLSLTLVGFASFAQYKEDETTKKGFQKDKLFTGGSVDFSLGSGRTAFGLAPYFGYSVIRWIDVAASLNFNYISQRDVYVGNDKVRQTTIGPGIFTRIFPVSFLFAQAQYEHNFIKQKYIPAPGGYYAANTAKAEANSFLVGAGYTSGRSKENNPYYFFSVMVDALSDPNSPYRDSYGRVIPIIRAGVTVPLFQGKKNK